MRRKSVAKAHYIELRDSKESSRNADPTGRVGPKCFDDFGNRGDIRGDDSIRRIRPTPTLDHHRPEPFMQGSARQHAMQQDLQRFRFAEKENRIAGGGSRIATIDCLFRLMVECALKAREPRSAVAIGRQAAQMKVAEVIAASFVFSRQLGKPQRLFDSEGEVTGGRMRREREPRAADSPVVTFVRLPGRLPVHSIATSKARSAGAGGACALKCATSFACKVTFAWYTLVTVARTLALSRSLTTASAARVPEL